MTGADLDGARARPDCYSRRPGIIETDLGSELILLDPMTEEMFSLNDVGRLILRKLGDAPAEVLAERVVAAFDVSYEVAAADVRALLDELCGAGLAVAVAWWATSKRAFRYSVVPSTSRHVRRV